MADGKILLSVENGAGFGNFSPYPILHQKQVTAIKTKHIMKKLSLIISCAVLGLGLTATHLQAAEAKDYQVTGPVLEVNPNYIVVQKGAGPEKWQIATDTSTKGAKPKVGDKVTVHYWMTASSVEVKADKKADK